MARSSARERWLGTLQSGQTREDEDVRKVLTALMVVLGVLAFGGFLLLAGFLVFVVSGMDPTR